MPDFTISENRRLRVPRCEKCRLTGGGGGLLPLALEQGRECGGEGRALAVERGDDVERGECEM